MKASVEYITPKLAAELLVANVNNRRLNSRRVSQLAAAMERGEWEENGDTIRISNNGHLLDGQHRLSAIVRSGMGQRFVVVRGVANKAFDTIDIGAKRSVGNILSVGGLEKSSSVAAIARKFYAWDKTGSPVHVTSMNRPTPRQIVDLVDQSPIIAEACEFVFRNGWLRKYMKVSTAGLIYCAGSTKDKVKTITFLGEVSGKMEITNEVTTLLREKLLENYGAKNRLDDNHLTALCFKALRSYLKNDKVRRLSVPNLSDASDKSPFRVY